MVNYIITEEEGIKKYDTCLLLDKERFKAVNNKIKIRILELLNKKPMYVQELAKSLKINEQNVYYHLREMLDLLDVVEEKKIRGTTARKFKPKSLNICLSLSNNFQDYTDLKTKSQNPSKFFVPFIKNGKLNAKIVVGSPDAHGKHKARARDGHYATDLALYLGTLCEMPADFSVCLDVDIKLKEVQQNLILVGGPITNLIMGEINKHSSINFIEEKQWGIKSKKSLYTDDNCGLIARVQNPYNKDYWIMIIAGVRYSGTKAAVIGLTRKTQLVLSRFTDQKEFYAVIQGFDMDGDGKIDSVELLE